MIFISLIVCLSCSEDVAELPNNDTSGKFEFYSQYKYVYESQKIDFVKIARNKDISIPTDATTEQFYYKFYTDLSIPKDIKANEPELNRFLIENMELIDGKIEYILNGEIVRIDHVENGILASSDCENPHDGHCDDDYPLMNECSYDGIQDCTQHSIYEEMNFVQKLACAASGATCILTEAAACIEDNCF